MAHASQLPEKFLLLIKSEFEKTSKEHLFKELAESLLESNPELGDQPDVLYKAVSALFQDAPGTRENDREHSEDNKIRGLILMEDNPVRRRFTEKLVAHKWNTHEHPPLSLVGDKHQYRQADGSLNNVMFPNLGKAGSRYVKAVRSERILPADRPDPGLLFDLLLARGDSFKPHESGFSSLFFVHATIITHDLFQTDRTDFSINSNSSYLDLSPLYGSSQSEQDLIRTFSNGLIFPDTFSDKRVLGLPPAVSVMLIMYNRFHNFAARNLAAINEHGRFTAADTDEGRKKRDNDLFQVARLVTNGLYANISVNEYVWIPTLKETAAQAMQTDPQPVATGWLECYVRAIFNVNKSTSNWTLDPQSPITKDGVTLPRGVGNHLSCEFNLLYRFHSALSRGNAKWTTEFFVAMFPNQDVSKLSLQDFLTGVVKFERGICKDPSKREFAGLKRSQPGGRFDDEALVRILEEAIEDQAGSFGANCVPNVLRPVEILGIMQARNWQVASLNEFRVSLGFDPLKTFEDINPDPYVAKTLETLYGHPDNVEMYPGMFVEQTNPEVAPGVGICAPYTVSGAVLADAVSLIRGDRHLTLDYTPAALTNWGIREVAPDRQTLGGSKMYQLILNAFPDWFKFNSVFAMQPFYTSEESRKIFQKQGVENLYSFDKAEKCDPIIQVTSHASVRRILEDQTHFKVPWGESGFLQTFMLAGDSPIQTKQRKLVVATWHSVIGSMQQFTDFAELISLSVLKTAAIPLGRGEQAAYQVDIVKDFGKIVALQYTSVFCNLPLKFEFNPTGTWEADQLYSVITNLTEYVLTNVDPTKAWALRREVTMGMEKLTASLEMSIKGLSVKPEGWSPPADTDSTAAIHTFGTNFTRQIVGAGTDIKETVEILIGIAIGILRTISTVFAEFIDFYLRPENKDHWTQIVALSTQGTPEADKILKKYILESARLLGPMGLLRNVCSSTPIEMVINQAGNKRMLKKGDRVFTCFLRAGRDPEVFPEPNTVKLDRPENEYLSFGLGPHECAGRIMGMHCMLTMVKTVAVLKNLRRMPGPQGHLKHVHRPGSTPQFMTPDWSEYTPNPTTMRLLFDQDS